MILPSPIANIAKATLGTPFENRLYMVGGSVRDHLLNLGFNNDFDLVTPLNAYELACLLHQKGGSTPVTYPRFGTAVLQWENHKIELVTARKEVYDTDSRKPHVETSSLFEDALRRDFTVNTLLYSVHQHHILDPLERGLNDLENRILRTPLDPKKTFFEDPLRMLRAVRFRWQLNFEPHPELYPAILEQKDRLRIISQERVRDEFEKMVRADWASAALGDLHQVGLLEIFASELSGLKGIEQGDQHYLDVWGHTLEVLNHLRGEKISTKLAGLLHDVGKPDCRAVIDDRVRFLNHEKVGAKKSYEFLKRMRFSNNLCLVVSRLVKGHMRIGQQNEYSDSMVRRLIHDFGEELEALIKLTCADSAAHAPGFNNFNPDKFTEKWKSFLDKPKPIVFKSPLTGDELCNYFNLSPGPLVGSVKKYLIDQVIEGHLAYEDKGAAFLLAQEYINRI